MILVDRIVRCLRLDRFSALNTWIPDHEGQVRYNPSSNRLAFGSDTAWKDVVADGDVKNSVAGKVASISTGTDTTNNSTVTMDTAYSTTLTLAAGTWSVHVMCSVLAVHSAGGSVVLEVDIGGSPDSANTVPVAAEQRVAIDGTFSSVAGSQTITISLKYRPSIAGTVTIRNPAITAFAIRQA